MGKEKEERRETKEECKAININSTLPVCQAQSHDYFINPQNNIIVFQMC